MKKSKVFVIVAIALVAVLAVAGVSFAAWNNLSADSGQIDVTVGKNVDLKATIDNSTAVGGTLVPTGAVKLADYVYDVTLGTVAFAFYDGDTKVDATNTSYKMYATVSGTGLVVKLGTTVVGQSLDAAVAVTEGGLVTVAFADNASDIVSNTIAGTTIKVTIHVVATVAE